MSGSPASRVTMCYTEPMKYLTEAELAEAKQNLAEARASLACEGMYFTEKEEALFRQFAEERLPHDECLRRAIEFCRQERVAKVAAAE